MVLPWLTGYFNYDRVNYMKLEEIIVWAIVLFGILFIVLAIIDERPYMLKRSGGDRPDPYQECIPDPVWGSCLP